MGRVYLLTFTNKNEPFISVYITVPWMVWVPWVLSLDDDLFRISTVFSWEGLTKRATMAQTTTLKLGMNMEGVNKDENGR